MIMAKQLNLLSLILCHVLLLFLIQSADGNSRSETLLSVLSDLLASKSAENTASEPMNSPESGILEDHLKSRQYTKQIDLLFAEMQAHLWASEAAQEFFVSATRFGLPSFEGLLFRDNYILSYDNRMKHPSWVLEHLTKAQFGTAYKVQKQPRYSFYCDAAVHRFFRSKYANYSRTGYDRGHMSPLCNNMANQEQFYQAFLMSNYAPQARGLNIGGGVWIRLERYITHLAQRSKNIYLVTGTLYMPTSGLHNEPEEDLVRYKIIGRNRVGVPSHFYKVFIKENNHGSKSMEAFLIPNSPDLNKTFRLEQFKLNIESELPLVERLTGLKFFALVNRKRVAKPEVLQYGYGGGDHNIDS